MLISPSFHHTPMSLRHVAALLLLVIAPLAARGDPPVASYIFPAGGRRGTTVDVKVGGLNLHSRCGFELLGPGVAADRLLRRTATTWFEGPILPLPESQQAEDYPKDMAGTVRIANGAAPGVRVGRVWTAQGAASGLAFVIGDLPEVVENEVDGPPVPQRVTLPVTINGRIFPREDVDDWTFSARNGQTITAEVMAGRLGSPLDARLTLYDASGRRIAENDPYPGPADAALRFTAPETGAYRLRIHDAAFQGGQPYVYRLTLTEGTPTEPADTPKSMGAMPIPATIRGRIGTPGTVDAWPAELKKGQTYEIDVKARRIHSPLLPVVVVRDPAGQEVVRFDAAQQNADPTLRFAPPADGTYRVEIAERFRGRGGPDFRYLLTVAQPATQPDFRLTLPADTLSVNRGATAKLKINAERRGDFKGPIDIAIDGLPAGVSAGKTTIIENVAAIEVPLTAASEARVGASRLTVRGTAKLGGRDESRVATASVLKGEAEVDSLLLAVTVPTPFVVKADYLLTQAPRGTVFPRRYRIERKGYDGPITVMLADRQARHLQGATGPTLVVPPGRNEFDYPLTMPPWMETGRTCRACVMAVGEVTDRDGSKHEVSFSSVEQNMQIIVVVEPGRLGLEPERTSLRAVPGGAAALGFTVQRGSGLTGAARVELLPADGVTAAATTVPADQTKGTIHLRFPNTGPRAFTTAILRATIIDKGAPVVGEARMDIVPR